MTTSLRSRSSWIESMAYKKTPDGVSYLVLFLKPYRKANGVENEPGAMIYGGPVSETNPPLPSWLPGLIAAGRVGEGSSENPSPGRVYHRMLKEGYRGQTVRGRKEVETLKEMMK